MSEADMDNAQNGPEYTSEFAYLYKNTGKHPDRSQQERREILLKEQIEKRHSLVDKHRDFSELFSEDESEEMCDVSEDMEVEVVKECKSKNRFVLMHSEWLTEVPVDLEENWLVKLAPDGFRVLLITKRNQTVLQNERGKVLLTLKTHLPGGGLSRGYGRTILDCIYSRVTKTIFVLDCLFWNTMSMIDSDTSFRFYWLRNQFDDNAKLLETNRPYKFQVLEFFPAQKSLIQDKVFENLVVSGQNVLYNGIVFYHKELQYDFKPTPLLGWLYTYMIPEKLGINVPQELMDKMPIDYECFEKYMEQLRERQEKKRHYYRDRRLERKKMDTS